MLCITKMPCRDTNGKSHFPGRGSSQIGENCLVIRKWSLAISPESLQNVMCSQNHPKSNKPMEHPINPRTILLPTYAYTHTIYTVHTYTHYCQMYWLACFTFNFNDILFLIHSLFWSCPILCH